MTAQDVAYSNPSEKADIWSRKIIHVDMDAFYASVELKDHPDLVDKPVAIGGPEEGRGVLSTCNYVARQFGVRSAMSTARAKKLCPDLILLPGRMDHYKAISRKIHRIFRRYTDLIEPLSLDEAFLDVSTCTQFGGNPTRIAEAIRTNIRDELELTASAGIAPNKLLAKISSDWNKPDGQFEVKVKDVSGFMLDLNLQKIPGVGKVSFQKLSKAGYTTCGELQRLSLEQMAEWLGKQGAHLYYRCRGIDTSPVNPTRERKSLSVEDTFAKDVNGMHDVLDKLPEIYQEFLRRYQNLRERKKLPQTKPPYCLTVKIKYADFTQTTIERHFDSLGRSHFKDLLIERYSQRQEPIRLLGVGVKFKQLEEKKQDTTGKVAEDSQLSLEF